MIIHNKIYTIPPLTKQYQKSYWTTELSTNKSEKAAQFYSWNINYCTTQDSSSIPGWQTIIQNVYKLNDNFKNSLLSF